MKAILSALVCAVLVTTSAWADEVSIPPPPMSGVFATRSSVLNFPKLNDTRSLMICVKVRENSWSSPRMRGHKLWQGHFGRPNLSAISMI